MPKSQNRSALVVPALAALVGFAILVGLGSWQMQRLAWKTDLIASIEARGKADPRALADLVAAYESKAISADEMLFSRVWLAGIFDHQGELHFYTIRNAKAGWRIVTPVITDAGMTVFVDRGFVPEALKSPESRAQGQLGGRQQLTGIVRLGDIQTAFVPDNNIQGNQWHWRDLEAMRAQRPISAKAAPLLVELVAPTPPGNWPEPAPIKPELPNRHLEYALTWYALAATLLAVFAVFMRGQLRRGQQIGDPAP